MKQEELLKSGHGSLAEFQPEMPITCPECREQFTAKLDRKSMTLKPIPTKKPNAYGPMMAIVTRYKEIKGFMQMSGWDKTFRARNLGAAKKLLAFFRRMDDPLGMSLECLEDISGKATKEDWYWTLETVVKHADGWLAEKQRNKE